VKESERKRMLDNMYGFFSMIGQSTVAILMFSLKLKYILNDVSGIDHDVTIEEDLSNEEKKISNPS
jgi:hypothetical protein